MKKWSKIQKICAALSAAVLLSLCTGCGNHAVTVATDTDKTTTLTEYKNATLPHGEKSVTGAAAIEAEAKENKSTEEKKAQQSAAEEKTAEEKATEAGKNASEVAQKKAETENKKQEQKETSGDFNTNAGSGSSGQTCMISISCSTILNNMEQCAENKKAIVPSDGVILPATEVSFEKNETVFDVLERVCQENGISLEFSYAPLYGSYYIEGIANLYEFDVGSTSGWMYKVNGWFPNYGCSSYTLSDKDNICWVYTCDLGSDVGGGYSAE